VLVDITRRCHDEAVAERRRAIGLAALLVALGTAACVLTVLAARADVDTFRGQPSSTVMDVAVGIAFVLAAVAARGAVRERLLFGAVGLAWLAGSSFAWALVWHQAVLLVALLAFPAGRVRGPIRWGIAAAAVVVAAERVPQLGVVALFAAVAVVVVADQRDLATAAYPAAAGIAVSGTLWYSWWNLHQPDQAPHPMVYPSALLAVAFGFPVASLAVIRRRRRLIDRVLGDQILGEFAGLQALLGRALGDDALVIDVWDAPSGEFRQVAGPASGSRSGRELVAYDGDQALARISTTSPAIGDRQTADAAVSVLRLAAVNQRRARRRQSGSPSSRRRELGCSLPPIWSVREPPGTCRGPSCRRCRWPPKRWRPRPPHAIGMRLAAFLPSRSMSCRRSGSMSSISSTGCHRSCSAAAE
jgi:hypothetical protein